MVDELLVSSQLILNTIKSSYMIITNKSILNSLALNICGTNIICVSCQNSHNTLHVTCKKSRRNEIFFRLTTFVPNKTLASLCFSQISSYLCYGITSWGDASPTQLLRVKRLQKRSAYLFFEKNSLYENIYSVGTKS